MAAAQEPTAIVDAVISALSSPEVQALLRVTVNDSIAAPVPEDEATESVQSAGRPRKDIDIEFACELLLELHMPLTKVASLCGVSRPTLYKHLKDEGINPSNHRFTIISDDELERQVRAVKQDHPNAGLVYLTGHLRSRGVHVQRRRIIDMLHTVDPIGVAERLRTTIVRRVYSVPCPNFMWHIDGHHKLINWKLVIHACVDGFSRTIVFLRCSDNNRAETVNNLFCEGTQQYGWPIKVRTDYGGENVKVWDEMTNHRRREGCVIAGSSVHNTRVERMHLDVKVQVVETFKAIFLEMEEDGLLSRDNDVDLFCLHYVFLPRINNALKEFRAAHNNHSLRTEGNQTPIQLFYANKHLIGQYEHGDQPSHHPGLSAQDLQLCELPYVPVNSVRCPLPRECLEQLHVQIHPLSRRDGRQTYLDVTEFVKNFIVR